MNSELTSFTSITRIVLIRPNQHGMIQSDREKEGSHDYNGRITYNRRCSPYPPNIRVHCQRDVQTWGDQVQEDWQELEGEAGGPARVHRQATRSRPEINKAGMYRQWTTKNLMALDLSLMDATPEEISLSTRLPFFSIGNQGKFCQGLLKTEMGVRVESVYVPVDNNPKYKAIETIHSGFRFRSRLEARWAVFFEALGIEYRYEPEGFDLDGTWYLPDFYLPKLEYWIEIKPNTPNPMEREKAIHLALATGTTTVLFAGDVWTDIKGSGYVPIRGIDTMEAIQTVYPHADVHWLSTTECVGYLPSEDFIFGFNTDREFAWSTAHWVQCVRCNHITIYTQGIKRCTCPSPKAYEEKTPSILSAFKAARQARF